MSEGLKPVEDRTEGDSDAQRLRVLVKGRVQGGFSRRFAASHAHRLSLAESVRKLLDGAQLGPSRPPFWCAHEWMRLHRRIINYTQEHITSGEQRYDLTFAPWGSIRGRSCLRYQWDRDQRGRLGARRLGQ